MPYGTLGNLRGGTRECHMARSDNQLIELITLLTHRVLRGTLIFFGNIDTNNSNDFHYVKIGTNL